MQEPGDVRPSPAIPAAGDPAGRSARIPRTNLHAATAGPESFVLTNDPAADKLRGMSMTPVRSVQRCYAQIYLAAHVDHVRTKSNRHHASAVDSSLLSHLDDRQPVRSSAMARHLGVSKSTLSARVKRLAALGYVRTTVEPRDRRRLGLTITDAGGSAMAAGSPLDERRLAALLERLRPAERVRAVAGLEVLGRAAREYQATARKRKRW